MRITNGLNVRGSGVSNGLGPSHFLIVYAQITPVDDRVIALLTSEGIPSSLLLGDTDLADILEGSGADLALLTTATADGTLLYEDLQQVLLTSEGVSQQRIAQLEEAARVALTEESQQVAVLRDEESSVITLTDEEKAVSVLPDDDGDL